LLFCPVLLLELHSPLFSLGPLPLLALQVEPVSLLRVGDHDNAGDDLIQNILQFVLAPVRPTLSNAISPDLLDPQL